MGFKRSAVQVRSPRLKIDFCQGLLTLITLADIIYKTKGIIMEADKRKSVRIKKSLVVQYNYKISQSTTLWNMSTIKDISETGMCIVTDRSFPPNEKMNFRIKIPSRPFEWLEFNGRIVDTEASTANIYFARVEFTNLQEEQKGLIGEYIKWFLDNQGGKE